jgi:hypothetical protein
VLVLIYNDIKRVFCEIYGIKPHAKDEENDALSPA